MAAARVRKADSDKIGFLLDAGAMAIICPMINTAQEVCRVAPPTVVMSRMALSTTMALGMGRHPPFLTH